MTVLPTIENKSILTPTSGFLQSGFTHTVNPYSGCAFASGVCGLYCYVQHSYWVTKGRPWSFYGVKKNIREPYRREYDRLKSPRKGGPKPLQIYLGSATDPYVPQERTALATRALLEEMVARPPDTLVLQTRNPLVKRDLELIAQIARHAKIWVSITVENDREQVPGLPPHVTSPRERLEVLRTFKEAGIPCQATVSPMFAIEDVDGFARKLDYSCDRVICDHYLLGDGSKQGRRTKKTDFPKLLGEHGYSEWNTLDKFYAVVSEFKSILGIDRVLVSAEGFNAV